MIRVRRPKQVPQVLKDEGGRAKRQLRKLYDSSPSEYGDGSKTFEFHSRIYGHESVKSALRAAQHDKCGFCESKVTHISFGDVEHFRPKKGYTQNAADSLGRPGYYWLAYEWSNLLFCCQICNQRHKRNHFPLASPKGRALSHHDAGKLKNERPIFVNPSEEEPADFLGFRGHYLYAKRGNKRGKVTIHALGLNREKLAEVRLDHLALLRNLKRSRALVIQLLAKGPSAKLSADLAGIDALVKRFTDDSAPYSLMARTALAD